MKIIIHMAEGITVETSILQQWVAENLTAEAIEERLRMKGLDQSLIMLHLKEYRKLKNAKKQVNGFIFMSIGAFVGFLSCVLTLTNAVPHLYNIILYGLTMTAILLIIYGLYLVVE